MILSKEQQQEYHNFSHNVKYLRLHNHLSKKSMAKVLGIGTKTLSKIEQGEFPPNTSIRIFYRIHQYFNLSPQHQLTRRLGEINE